MAEQATKQEGPFWTSRKFWYAVLAVGAFLALALTGTMQFTSGEAITVILSMLGINVGAHTTTDVAAIVGKFFGRTEQPSEPEPEPEDETNEDGGVA